VTAPTQPPDEGFNEKDQRNEMDVAEVHGSILREQSEPRNGAEPVPLWLLTVFFSIIFWAGLYLAYNSGGFRADVFDPTHTAAAGDASAQAGPVDPKILGKRVFTQNCMVCHQTTGLGIPGQFPPLVGSEWVLGQDWHGDNHLVKILLKGLQGPVQVKGVTYNNAMPPWSQLTDEQIATVLTYIRSEWGNAASPISAAYVKEIRDKTTDRTEPWTMKDLQAIPAEMAPAEAPPAAAAPAPGASPAAPGASPAAPAASPAVPSASPAAPAASPSTVPSASPASPAA
jgi:mono/diheme cytochrome c family protein